MSAYIQLATPMTDQECILNALTDNGLQRHQIEVFTSPITLSGWQGGRTANIVIRKEITGDHYNDIGFLETPTGYRAVLSDDYQRFGRNWLTKVNASYQTHWTAKQERIAEEERQRIEEKRQQLVEAQRQAVHEKAKRMGYRIQESRENGTIRMVLVKRVF